MTSPRQIIVPPPNDLADKAQVQAETGATTQAGVVYFALPRA